MAALAPLTEAEVRDLQRIFLHYRGRILRKLAILRSSRGLTREPRPASLGLQELVAGRGFEHRGAHVAWATEVLRRDLDSNGTLVGALEQGWFTLEDLRLPAPEEVPCELGEIARAEPWQDPERCLWIDSCVASLEPFEQDFLLCREYDGGSWQHVATLMHRSVPACVRFHAGARESLRRLVRQLLGRSR